MRRLVARDSGEVLTSTEIRLRSGDTPDSRQWAVADSIGQHPEKARCPRVRGRRSADRPGLVVTGEPR